MTATPFPPILDRIAAAGEAGLALESIGDSHALTACRAWGFGLKKVEGRIVLPPDPDLLVPAWIERETPAIAWSKLRAAGFFEVGSTNEEALELGKQGAPEGTLVHAECQTAGRGRKGRHWISRPRAGLFFSIILKPGRPLADWPLLVHATSVALVRAFRELEEEGTALKPFDVDLKWPNDVLLSGKKVAGILIETGGAGLRTDSAVIGVGINVAAGSVPEEMAGQATFVNAEAGSAVPRRRLLVLYLKHLQVEYGLFERGEYARILQNWKKCSSMWNGVAVDIIEGERTRSAVTCGLTDRGELRVRWADGKEEVVVAGDVSLRRA